MDESQAAARTQAICRIWPQCIQRESSGATERPRSMMVPSIELQAGCNRNSQLSRRRRIDEPISLTRETSSANRLPVPDIDIPPKPVSVFSAVHDYLDGSRAWFTRAAR
jgi:hypothetical protein